MDMATPDGDTEPNGVPSPAIATAFSGMGWDSKGWAKHLGSAEKTVWLRDARLGSGVPGGAPATWNPIKIALHLHLKRRVPLPALDKAFRNFRQLRDWRTIWEEHSESLREWVNPGG
jgi:hypothetical protein